MKKFLKIIGILFISFILLFVLAGVIVYLTVDIDEIINAQKEKHLPMIEQKIGRKITVGPISTTFLKGLGANIADVKIEPNPNLKEDDRPLIQIAELGLRIDTIKAIMTLGKDIEISAIYVNGFKANIVKLADGSLSIDDILKAVAGEEKPIEEEEKKDAEPFKLTPEQVEIVKGVKISYIGFEDAEFRFLDLSAGDKGAEAYIKDFDFVIKDIRITDPIKISLNMAAFSDKQNVFIETIVGPFPENLEIKGMPRIQKVKVDIQNVDVGNISPYLGKGMPLKIEKANFSMNYSFSEVTLDKPLPLNGFVELKNLQMQGGTQFDFRLDTDMTVDPNKLEADIAKLGLKIGDIAITMKGKFTELQTAPKFKGFALSTNTLNVSKIISYYPELKKSLPPDFDLAGNIIIDVKADGDAAKQVVDLLVDMSGTRLYLKDTVDKKPAIPLKLVVKGEFSAEDADIKDFKFDFGKLNLAMSGTVKNFKEPQFDLKLESNKFTMDDIARLVPAVQQNIPEDVKIAGAGELKSFVKGGLKSIDAGLDFNLSDVALKVPDTELNGTIKLHLLAKGNPEADMKVKLDADLDKARIFVKDALDKRMGTPMNMRLDADKKGDRVEINALNLTLAEMDVRGGGWINYASNALKITIDLKPLPLDKWAKTVIALKDAPTAGGVTKFNLTVDGDPNKMETVKVDLKGFELKMGKNIVRADLTVVNPEIPDIKFAINIPYFNMDEVFPPSPEDKKKKEKEAKQSDDVPPKGEDNPFLEKIKVDGTIKMGMFIVSEFPIENFDAVIKMKDGVVNLPKLGLRTYKGTIKGDGTKVNIAKFIGPYDVKLNISGLDMNALLSAQADLKNKFYGTFNGAVNVSGKGLHTYFIKRNMSGTIGADIRNGRYDGANITQAIAGPIVQKIPGGKLNRNLKDRGFRQLKGDFSVVKGRFVLQKPMIMDTPDGNLELDGSIGMDKSLDLKGTYNMSAKTASAMLMGKCKMNKPLPVPLRIRGTVSSPKVAGLEVDKTAKAVAQACLGKQIDEAIGDVKEKAQEKVEETKKAVKEKAEKTKKKAKEKAKKETKKAKDKAKKKAKDKLKKMF